MDAVSETFLRFALLFLLVKSPAEVAPHIDGVLAVLILFDGVSLELWCCQIEVKLFEGLLDLFVLASLPISHIDLM